MNNQTVAVIGLGAMGSRLAQNLLQSDYSVVVHNRTPEKAQTLIKQGAVFANNPRDAVEQSDVVISMVTNDESFRQIWLTPETGAAWGLNPNKIAIEMSTLTVNWVHELNKTLSQLNVSFLEAPVVGSRPQADARKLISLVGGEFDALSRVKSVLTAAGISSIQHIGPVGQGMAMKLAVNALFGIQVAALAEVLGMLAKHDITPSQSMESLAYLPIMSMASKGAGGLMVSENHAPLFPISLVEKDLSYILQTSEHAASELPTTHNVLETFRTAIAQDYGNDNITGISQLFFSPTQIT